MNMLNYFFRYDRSNEKHEDHLTRAFLILLKYSNSVMMNFYNFVTSQIQNENVKPLHEASFESIDFETQKKSLPEVNYYVSILLTDQKIDIDDVIKPVEREAVYDGIVKFGEELVFFIETKPNNSNVWISQLCPAKKDIPEECEVYEKAIVIEWKQIISILQRINSNVLTTPGEQLLIDDFFEFMNTNYPNLNPYNDLSVCINENLAEKRIEQILLEIAASSDLVKKQARWGMYIDLDFKEIKKIALLLNKDESGLWNGITIMADFGSTVSQARTFYERIKSFDDLSASENFDIKPNFHLAFKNQNIMFFESDHSMTKSYFDYWSKEGMNNYGGVLKEKLVDEYLKVYSDKNLIILNPLKEKELEDKILNKRFSRINICPALNFTFTISREQSELMDAKGELVPFISKQMKNVLGLLKLPLNTILK